MNFFGEMAYIMCFVHLCIVFLVYFQKNKMYSLYGINPHICPCLP